MRSDLAFYDNAEKKKKQFLQKAFWNCAENTDRKPAKKYHYWIVDTAVTAEDGAGWTGLQFFENGLWKMVPAGMYLYDGICGIVLLLGSI